VDDTAIQSHLVSQYQASLAMLRKAIHSCPEDLWLNADFRNRFWHIAYHTLFYTHFYVQAGEADFRPWIKHRPDSQYLGTRSGASGVAIVIDPPYSREEVFEYHEFCCAEIAAKVPAFALSGESGFHWLPFDKLELHLYNIRHVQHHTGQLADRLRAHADIGVPWVRMG
jgi:hypothetical protein